MSKHLHGRSAEVRFVLYVHIRIRLHYVTKPCENSSLLASTTRFHCEKMFFKVYVILTCSPYLKTFMHFNIGNLCAILPPISNVNNNLTSKTTFL